MEFEHVGNAECLELANTIPDRSEGGARDWLADPAVATAWAASLEFEPARPFTTADLASLADLRDAVHTAFAALADGASVPHAALATVTEAHAAGLGRFGYVARDGAGTHGAATRDGAVTRDWPARWTADALAARFAESAVAELTGDRLDRLKACPSCGWLFIDTSRNGGRRWCSMRTCGSRDKALRHYRRRHTVADA
ncbi:hypothetical protein FLP10_04600 [Agromyces intestinalis]|uniref:Zinc finger CGNR domain-containing protein n=1 Tax=Agromyces intestinalis TaxID=2592652 RepID=A0A5C1YE27_9MICO|nr:CGNR zinc finger domain-containing protein [Agromyces intestinalis]QEO13780.1 hypothetical protein FLP10_04600 [Agromyces intestinalis]